MSKKEIFTDKQLFTLISKGSEHAFSLIFERYHKRMLLFSRQLLQCPYASEEVVQEVFIRLWENRDMLLFVKNPADYIFIVVRNYGLNYLRSMLKKQGARELLWAAMEQRAANADAWLEASETEQLLRKVEAKLSAQQQKVFRMSRDLGLSHQEIANELHISKNTVKKHVAESLKVFKTNLKQRDFYTFFTFF